jgi:XTP/dITP diphosphohydrolase
LLKNNKILLASSNQGKIREFKKIFKRFDLISQVDLGINDVVEDGISFFENALKKARHGSNKSGLLTVADDSGLVVPDLGYGPGIYSARYAGEGASDKDNRDKIIDELNKKNISSLHAFYICVLVGVRSDLDPIPLYSVGEIHGKISTKSSGDGGFGYDKIFYPNGYDVSMASIDPEEKNKISHRAIAAKSFIKELEKL